MHDLSFKYESLKEEDTLLLGEKIGELVEPGQIILLAGELGAGKTRFVQGLARSLGIDDGDVTSPTFNLINEHEGDLPLYHMDLYRLDDGEDLYDLGFEEYLEMEGVIVIEWPDIAYGLLPPDYIYVNFKITGEKSRLIEIEAEGEKGEKLLEGIFKNANYGN